MQSMMTKTKIKTYKIDTVSANNDYSDMPQNRNRKWLYSEEYDKVKNHWIQCGGQVTLPMYDLYHTLIGDENILTEFYLTFNESNITVKFKEI